MELPFDPPVHEHSHDEPDYRLAFLVMVDAAGVVHYTSDLTKVFSTLREANAEDIRRASREVYEHLQTLHTAEVVRNLMLAPPPGVTDRLREAAKERGLA